MKKNESNDLYSSLFRENIELIKFYNENLNEKQKELLKEQNIKDSIVKEFENLKKVDLNITQYLQENNENRIKTLTGEVKDIQKRKKDIFDNLSQREIDENFINFYNKKSPAKNESQRVLKEWYNAYKLSLSKGLINFMMKLIYPEDTLILPYGDDKKLHDFLTERSYENVLITDEELKKISYIALYRNDFQNPEVYYRKIDKNIGVGGIESDSRTITLEKNYEKSELKMMKSKSIIITSKGLLCSMELIKKAEYPSDIFMPSIELLVK